MERNRQEKYTYLSLHWRKTDKKKKKTLSCVIFSSAFLRLHWRVTDKKNTTNYLSCLFFSSSFLSYTGEKQTRKIHLLVFLVCF